MNTTLARFAHLSRLACVALLGTLLASAQGCATLQVDVARRSPKPGEAPTDVAALGTIAAHDASASVGQANSEKWVPVQSAHIEMDPDQMYLVTADAAGKWVVRPISFAELSHFRARNILTPEEAIPGRHRVAESKVNLTLANAGTSYDAAAAKVLPSLDANIASLPDHLRAGWAANETIGKDPKAAERLSAAVAKAEASLPAAARPGLTNRPSTDFAIDHLYALGQFRVDATQAIEQAHVSRQARDAAVAILNDEVTAAAGPTLAELDRAAAMYDGILANVGAK